tara:strand:+ start:647 stop:850 length:204 start_codon:yes stop_codon:yes gene_type:complete
MLKSYEQQRIEQEYDGLDIFEILVGTLTELRGQRQLVAVASLRLGISGPTLRHWCNEMGIEIKEYIQ